MDHVIENSPSGSGFVTPIQRLTASKITRRVNNCRGLGEDAQKTIVKVVTGFLLSRISDDFMHPF
ncbi:MAG: hypothetical protein NTV00_08130 [Methylococcales bacterium]|nr:hypothetical protein [Methylococcales bacterium]